MRYYVFFLSILICSCNQRSEKPAGTDEWLAGDDSEKFSTISRHLRGLDMAMVETGYRYSELYWAGRDQNWDYALYQLAKIKLAIENGIERRPQRESTARGFLDVSIPAMREAVQKRDTSVFNRAFILFQSDCQSCHLAEKVPFITTTIPQIRLTPVKFSE